MVTVKLGLLQVNLDYFLVDISKRYLEMPTKSAL